MPVIPFSSASRVVEVDRAAQEQRDIEEARRYREQADAKLKELMNTPVKRFDPNGGTSPIAVPEPVTGGWRVRTNGDPQQNGDALPGGVFNRMGAPDIDDPMRDEQGFGGPDNWTPELAMPASPEGESFVGMGSGGPEQPVGDGGLSEDQIADIRDRLRIRKEGDSTRELRARMLNAPNADQAAIDADLAERQGVNRLEVERNRDTFVAVDRAQAIDDLRKTAPKLRAWLDYNPANLEVAHDDVENLGWWEQTQAFFSPGNLSLEKAGQALQSGFVDKIPEQLYGLDQMLAEANMEIYKALPDWVPGKFGLVNEQVDRALNADMRRREAAIRGKDNAPVGETWLERGVYGAFQSAPSTVTSLVISLITKSPVLGAGSMGATTAGGAFGEARDEGKSFSDSLRYALTQGGIETATEFLPFKGLLDDLAKDAPLGKMFLRNAVTEGIGEQAATFLQDASTWIELNPDKTVGEFWAERPNAALETLVASTLMSGVQTTIAKGLDAGIQAASETARQKRAEDLAKTFDAMAQNAADSKLLKRLPEKYRELVNQVTKDGPLESVRVAPEAFTELAQTTGTTTEELAQAFRIDPNEIVQAMSTGEDVVIPAGNYAAGIAGAKKAIGLSGEAIHQAFAPNMRLRADDFTAKESAAMKAVFEAEQEARKQAGETVQTFADSADRVREAIRQQVVATGMYSSDVANTQAEIVGAMVTTLAERTGRDPEALWKDQGFDIIASLSSERQQDNSLEQTLPDDATPTQRLIDMRARGMKNPEIAASLYPEVDTQTAVNRVKALASKNKAKIEERKAALEGATSLAQEAVSDPLAQEQGGTFTPRADRSIIRLFERRNLATLSHEGAHWYLDTLWRMSKTENPHPFVLEQLAAVLEWHGKSPNWDAMFNPDGSFTQEGVDLQEAFAETFEAYLREGKAPSVGLRSVFAAFKQWLLRAYKSVASIGNRVRINDEIRQVFDRMLVTDEAIRAAQSNLTRDSEAMAKALLEKGVITEKQFEKTRERIQAARERAEAALMARLMDEYERSQKAWWNDETRQTRREVASEIDERPEQRAYQVLAGVGWRDTREAATEEAARQAEAMTSLAQTEQAKAVERLQMVAERGERTLAERVVISAAEREAINASAAETGLSVREITDAVRSHKAAHPIAQGWAPLIYVRTEIEKGKIAHQYQNVPYTFSSDANGKQLEPGTAAYDRRVNSVARSMLEEVRSVFRRAANGDRNAQNILAQAGWYKAMRTRLRQEFGGLGDLFADLLGATSPNTPVRGNWANAVEALRRASRGDFDDLILQWEAWADKLDAVETDLRAWFNERLDEGLKKNKIKGLPEYKEKLAAVRAAREISDDLLPTKESDAKYGFNGHNVIRAMVDLWRVVKNADPDIARGGTAPKAINFSGNLIGFRSRATIDVWAARLLQRLTGGRRLPSMVEVSLSGDMREDGSTTLQFGFGQDAFTAAVAAIRADPELQTDAGLAEINDDDLQAVVWFIEKEIWTINNWTNSAGEGGSFELEANLTGTSQQERVKELRRIIDASAPTATVTAANQDTTAALKAIEDHELAHAEEIEELRKLESGEVKGSKKRMAELGKIVRPPAEATRLLANVERAKAKLERLALEKVAAKGELAALEREVDRFVGGLSIQMSQDTQGIDFVPTDSDMARLGAAVRQAIYEADDKSAVLGSKALSTEGRYGGSERSLDLEVVAREGYNANTLWREMLRQAQAARQDSTFLSRVLRVGEKVDPLRHRPGVEIYLRSAASQEQLESVLADLAKEGVEFLTVIVDGRRMAESMGGAMPAAVGVRLQYVPEFEQRYGMDDLSGLDDAALAAKIQEKARELRAVADRVSEAVEGVSFAGQFWYETQTAFSHQYQDKIDALATGPSEGSAAGAPDGQRWQGDAIRSGLESADRQAREATRGEPGGDVLGGDAGTGPQSLAQTVGEPRQLDAMGFYSAAQEAAQRVPDGIWQMGWQAARNSLAKGRDGVVPKKTEIEYLGLDAMFGDTKLKGAELKTLVLEHIAAKRLSLVENFARFDPNVKAPTKAAILDEIDDDTLGFMMGVAEFSMGFDEGRIVASELDGAEEFHTGLFVHLNKQEVSDDPVKRYDMPRRTYNLYRGLNLPGKRELVATGVIGDLLGKAARIILNENRSLVMRKISAANMRDYWEQSRTTEDAGLTRGPGDIRLPGEDVPLFEAVIGLPEGVPGSDYRAPVSHVGGKAKGTLVTAHGEERIDDKGQRTVFVGQVQSDMAQGARELKLDQEANKRSLELVIERSGIVDRETAAAYMKADGATDAGIAEFNDADLIGFARQRWAVMNHSSYNYARHEYLRERDRNILEALDAPLLSTSEWTNVAVRSMLYRAAREGFQSISFPTAETSEIIQGNDSAAMHYETNVKGALEKIGKQLGGEVRKGDVRYQGDEWAVFEDGVPFGNTMDSVERAERFAEFRRQRDNGANVEVRNIGVASAYILDITPAMRAKIMSEGFPLFHTRPGVATTTPPPDIPPMRLNLQAVLENHGEKALADLPPEVAAYAMEASDVEAYIELARTIRSTLAKKRPKTLWKFLSTARKIGSGNDTISYRGIRDPDGELLKIIGERKEASGLIAKKEGDGKRSRSYDIEQAAMAAWEAGYFSGESPPSPAEFLDALRADLDGSSALYARDDLGTVAEMKNAEQWAEWFDQNDVDIRGPVAEQREKLAIVATAQGSNAISPDEAAPFFKMRDGAELLEAIKQGPLRDKLIREETERRMIERHGDIFKTGKVMEEAQVYARNEIQHRQFEIELDALAQAAGMGAASNLAKQQAIENLRSKQVREVLNYNQWLVLERRWAQKAMQAAAKGDMAKAQEYARYRLINSHMFVEGRKMAEKIEKTRKQLLKYEGKTQMARLFAAGKDYAEQMRGLLSDYQLRNESKKAEDKRTSRAVWLQTQMTGIDPFAAYGDPTKSAEEQRVAAAEAIERSSLLARLAEGVEARNYKSITVEEFMAVRDEADLIYRLATLKDRLIKEGERRKLSLAAEDIAAEIEKNQPNEKGPEPLETDTAGERIKSSMQMYFAMHRTLQSLAHQFAGGKEGGVFWRYIVRPLNEAFARLTTIRKQMGDDVAGLFGVYTAAEQERFYRDRRSFAGIGRSLTTQGRLAIALNWGNEKNRRRIMDAYGWDEAQVQEVLDSLDKRDWDWVQSVWDYMDTWFPEANRVHEAVHGMPMDKVEPLQVATRFGVYRGGYYPIKYDPKTSSKSGQRAMEADSKGQTGRIGVRTKEGFTKKRVEGKVTLPLRLSALDVIMQHLDEVAKSIATEETFFDVGRILKQKQVEDAIVSRHGRQIYKTIVAQVVTAKFGMDGTSGLLAHLRNGATVVGLSWKVATASLQILGASNSIVRVGGPWVAMGYAKAGTGGIPLYTAARDAMRKSEFMRNRRENQSPEMASLLDAVKNKWTPGFIAAVVPRELRAMHNFMVRNGFALMSNVQFASVDVPTWWGAYFKAQSTGASEADSVAMADQAVIDAQGGGEISQLAAMQSGAGVKYGALLRILTNFMSYMITTYNLGTQRVRNARTPAQIMALGFDLIILAAVPVAGKMALDLITRGIGEDDEPEEWAEKYAREQIAFLFGPFVGISQFAGSARGDDAYGYKGPAGLAIFNEMNQLGAAVAEGDFDESFWKPANRAAGMIFHYPASQIDASVRGAQAYFNGETDNPAAFLYGPAPAN